MTNENIGTSIPADPYPAANDKALPHFSRIEAWRVLPAGMILALLYAACFSGISVLPQISFTLFCPAAFLTLTGVLKGLRRLKNKRALWWGLPIMLTALCNGIFHANFFTWTNAMLVHGLFAAYILTALREQPTDLCNLSGLFAMIRMVFGHWFAFVGVFRTAFIRRKESKLPWVKQILLGTLIAAPVLLIITALLISADAVLSRLTTDFFDALFYAEWINISFIVSFILAWIYLIGYVCLGIRTAKNLKPVTYPVLQADPIISATFLVLVNAVFVVFTFIQIAFLFNGGFLQLPEGMVYSQYAREGFFQLLFVTCINFSVIIFFMTALSGVQKQPLLRGLLLALCFFTGILIASSLYRMSLYTGVYGHTVLRLCVFTFLAMEIVLLIVTVHKLFDDRVPFIRRYIWVGLIFYLLVNVTGSDYSAAKLNTGLFLSGQLDYIDLHPVGPDGLNALRPLLEDEAYICADNWLMRVSDYETLRLRDDPYLQSYDQLMQRYAQHTKHWQNFSLLKQLP